MCGLCEVLMRFGSDEQKEQYLKPLLDGGWPCWLAALCCSLYIVHVRSEFEFVRCTNWQGPSARASR